MNLKITEGITSEQINDLINYSNSDELILKTTRDDSRFRDKTAVKLWLKKNRKIYTLSNDRDKLLGIIWFGKEKMPDINHLPKNFYRSKYGITFAIRIYADARGKGNAKPFMKSAFEKYKKTEEYKNNPSKGIWLETQKDNIAALASYKNFGFSEIDDPDLNGKVIMILKIE